MSKRNIIIIILALIIAGVSAYSYFFVQKNQESNSANQADGGFFSNLFPSSGENTISSNKDDSSNGTDTIKDSITEEDNEDFGEILEPPKQLTMDPISGYGVVSTSSARYIESATGHIYEVDFRGENYSRLSNTTLLKTEESFWSPKADKVLVRYLNGISGSMTIKNYSAVLPKSASSTELTGAFLTDFRGIAVSSYEEALTILEKNANKYDLILTNFENSKRKLLASFPIGQFNLSWSGKNTVTLLTKPAKGIPGFLYGVDIKTGAIKKIAGGESGFTASLSPLNNFAFYSKTDDGGSVKGYFYDVKKNLELSFNTDTLADKCAWSNKTEGVIYCAVPKSYPAGVYPDDWYKGAKSTEDRLWLIDALTGEVGVLSEDMGGSIDTVDIKLTSDENYLLYKNKKDDTLWVMRIR